MLNLPQTYQGKRLIHSWIYCAKDGAPLGVVGRYECDDGRKDVIPFFKQKGEHWTAGINLNPRPLFGLEKLALHPKNKAVFVVEGEKCTAALQSIGCCAVTSLGGSQAANKSDWSPLNGCERVIILPDNDEQGLKYVQDVAVLLSRLDHPPMIEIKLLEGLSDKGGDIVDWLKQRVPEWNEYQPIDSSKAEDLKLKLSEALKQAKVAEVARIAAPMLDECEPEPLRALLPPAEDYPVDELGSILSRAAMALHQDIKAPLAMCAQSVLAVASYAVQAHFDIQLPWGEQKPCTLFFLTVGESGSRKSSVDNTVLSGIKAKQKSDQKQYMGDLEAYKAQDSAWQKAVEQSRKKAVGPKEFVTAESILKADSLCGEKPKPPIMPIRLISDPTIEGLYKLLEKNQPNVALFSDEAGLLIGGHALNSDNALKTMTRWSKMWDGAPFDRVRSADGAGVLYGRRMAMHQLAQPEVMTMLLSNRMANEQGLLARCLVAWPDSLIGSRIDDEYRIVSDRAEIQHYIKVIDELVDAPPRTTENAQELDPIPLPLSKAAVTLALESSKRFEQLMAKGQDLAELTDRAAKAIENACRIACVLAVIDSGLNTKEISAEHMAQALCIIQWYLNEALRIRSVSAISPSTIDAELLSAWLKGKGIKAFRSTQVLNGGPNSLRDKPRFYKAVDELVKCGYLVENPRNTQVDGVKARLSWGVLHYVVRP